MIPGLTREPRRVAHATADDGSEALHVAAVQTSSEVCFLTAAPTRARLTERLAAYAREQAPVQLRFPDAARIAELAALGRHEDVVRHYFSTVGERWDEERLVVAQVPADGSSGRDV